VKDYYKRWQSRESCGAGLGGVEAGGLAERMVLRSVAV